MKNRSEGYSSDSEQSKGKDLSILGKPIYTSCEGFLESKRAYDKGTDEIRRLLAFECSIIYECKVCRNMFRSLTNFLSHKRAYCRKAFSMSHSMNSDGNGFIDKDISTIIQAEEDYVNHSTTKDNKNNGNSGKNLSSVIEKLLQREQANRLLKIADFYEQVNLKLTQEEILRKKHVLQLDKVPNSDVAVYQTVKNNDADNIKDEVIEVQDLLLNNKTVLGPDGKVIQINKNTLNNSADALTNANSITNNDVTCDICQIKFSTEKTLKLHIQKEHITSTYVYQCPSCPQTFLQPGAVLRHLSSDHKKSIRRVRTMRDSIIRKKVRLGEIHVKGPSRELARLQIQKDKDEKNDETNDKVWSDNINTKSNAPMCTYCHKTFERKAVLTTHLNSCPMKLNKKDAGSTNIKDQPKTVNENGSTVDMDSEMDHIPLATLRNSPIVNENGNYLISDAAVSKRKRKKTAKVALKNEVLKCNADESYNEMIWNMEENLSLKSRSASLDDLSKTSETNTSTVKENNESIVTNANTSTASNTSTTKEAQDIIFCCKICKKKFDVLSNVRRHMSMFHYRRRKYGCKICDYRAFRKYDVVNHLHSVHSITGEKDTIMDFIVVQEDKTEKSEDNNQDILVIKNGTISLDDSAHDMKLLMNGNEKPRRRAKRMKTSSPKLDISNGNTELSQLEEQPIEQPQLQKQQQPQQQQQQQQQQSQPQSQTQTQVQSQTQPQQTQTTDTKAQSKFTRSSSNVSLSSADDSLTTNTSKRPIRNRVKPVNKDFLYDLSNLLKKDMVLSESDSTTTLVSTKTQKRRNTLILSEESSRDFLASTPAIIDPIEKADIQGAAMRMAKFAVAMYAACLSQPPAIPIERPIVPIRSNATKLDASNENIRNFTPVTLNPDKDAINDRSLIKQARRISDDVLFKALTKKRKLQHCISDVDLTKSKDDSLLFAKKESLQINGNNDLVNPFRNGIDSDKKVAVNATTEKEIKQYVMENNLSEPVKKIQVPSFIETPIIQTTTSVASPKRITLMQRLAENKQKKKQESLLKSALEK